MNNKRISLRGASALLICGVTPLARMLIGGSGLLTWVLIPSLFFLFLNIKSIRYINRLQILVILISGWLAVSTLYSPVYSILSLEDMKVQICTIIIFLCALNYKEEKVLIGLTYISAVYFIYCYFYSSDFYMGGIRKYILIQGNIWLDPNMVIAGFFVPALFAVIYFIKGKYLPLKVLFVIFLAFSAYGAMLGGSRGGLLAIIAGAVTIVIKEFKIGKKVIFPILGGFIVLVIIVLLIQKYIPQELIERMTLSSVQESGGSGRFDIYSIYLKTFFEQSNLGRIIFGYGKESCVLVLGKAAHNILLDYLWDMGICGLVLHLIVVFNFFSFCWKSRNSLSLGIIIATMVWSLTISTSDQLMYWVLMYIAVTIARNTDIFEREDLHSEVCLD